MFSTMLMAVLLTMHAVAPVMILGGMALEELSFDPTHVFEPSFNPRMENATIHVHDTTQTSNNTLTKLHNLHISDHTGTNCGLDTNSSCNRLFLYTHYYIYKNFVHRKC